MRTRQQFLDEARQYRVPEHTAHGLANYLYDRIPPGGFLGAVLSNDLLGSFGRADSLNRNALQEIMSFVYNAMPSGTWGTPEAVRDHLNSEVPA